MTGLVPFVVFLVDEGPQVLDCIEFDDELRYGDTLADVAFLAMDLERLGHRLAQARLEAVAAFLAQQKRHVPLQLVMDFEQCAGPHLHAQQIAPLEHPRDKGTQVEGFTGVDLERDVQLLNPQPLRVVSGVGAEIAANQVVLAGAHSDALHRSEEPVFDNLQPGSAFFTRVTSVQANDDRIEPALGSGWPEVDLIVIKRRLMT